MHDLISQMQRTIRHNLHIGERFSHLGVELRIRMLHTMSVSGIAVCTMLRSECTTSS